MSEFVNSSVNETASIFSNVRIRDSIIQDRCVVGDDSDLMGVEMDTKSEFGRRNLIRKTRIGYGSYTGTNTIVKNCEIGKFTCISWNVSIGGGDHNYHNTSLYTDYWYKRIFGVDFAKNGTSSASLITKIGSDCWIAAGVNILKGVVVGDGCVIGAGAVVTRDLEPYSIAVGIPARVVKKRFSDEIIELLLKLKWWDWPIEKLRENLDLLRKEPNKEQLLALLAE